MPIKLVCPRCQGTLYKKQSTRKCANCHKEFLSIDGCIDFAGEADGGNSKEKNFYEQVYNRVGSLNSEKRFGYKTEGIWFDRVFPSGKDILSRLSDLSDKDILCLGNGTSLKELYFAKKGASLWISDLSLGAVLQVKNSAPKAFQGFDVRYHAIDALHLPFEDSSLDVVYGFAFVHHLSNKVPFLKEAYRVLKPEGMCIFFDDAFSPIWQLSKTSLLKPLMQYIHKKRGISPEDLRATLEGGFTKRQVKEWGNGSGFQDYFFIKRELLLYLWLRCTKKVFGCDQSNGVVHFVASILLMLDRAMASISRLYQDNMIRLVWGYKKV